MAEKLNSKVVSFSLAITSGIVYILCAFLIAIAPQLTLIIFKNMFHEIDITKIASTPIPLGSIIIGFIEIVVLSLIAGWLFATIYNYLQNKINGGKK